MSVIAVTSSRTSPGATTLAAGLAIAWSHQCERSLLIEADPSGGVLSLRFDLAPAPSLATFGSDIRNGYSADLLWSNTQDMRGVHCIPAPVDPRLASSWTERVTPVLVEHLRQLGAPAVIDLGWVGEGGPSLALATAADTTLVVTTTETAEVQALLFQVRQLTNAGANVALVVVGDRANDPQEIARLAGVPLAAVLPEDQGVAAALAGGAFKPKRFKRSLLWRTISGLAGSLLDQALLAQRSPDELVNAEPMSPEPMSPEPMSVEPVTTFDGTAAQPSVPVPSVPAPVVPDIMAAEFGPAEVGPEPTVQMPRQLVLSNGERHEVTIGAPVTIGRHSSCDVTIADREISRHHGTLTFTDQGWLYTDNNSRNGSFVNGQRCNESVLTVRDELVIGQTTLSFTPTRIASYV